ncbi:dTMP kinase [Dactylosporangium matsuzakiense]|uniref:Thymidylate kinase n=1 Tax=Dactylosporangium matsuzakiense TaxID=53360 RepID=A0A9W6KLL3_9ACTN|nr:dTMP kinase [Dactylosporangium matsuzakiense]
MRKNLASVVVVPELSGVACSVKAEILGGAAIASSDLSGFGELQAVLRIRPFRRLWAVLGLSSLGDWLGLLAASTFAAAQVSDPAAQGVAFGSVIAVRLLPALILGPVAGVFADRFDRRLTMVVCDLLRFLFFASIPAAALVLDDSALIITWTAIATFVIETVAMIWTPAKEAAVPNLLPRARLETANQLTLATTYGITPVAAALVLIALQWLVTAVFGDDAPAGVQPSNVALWFNACTFLATAATVFFGIREISGRRTAGVERKPGMIREFTQGWAFVSKTPLVRGLVLGIFGAFAGGGVVVGTAKFYAQSLGAGTSAFALLFAVLFLGLGAGIAAGPKLVGALSRRRWFGLSIILAAGSVLILAVAGHLTIAVGGALLVGVGAGMAFLSGTTLLGGEVADDMRGRAFAFVQMGTRVVLMLTISLSSVIVGLGGTRTINLGVIAFDVSSTRPLLAIAGVLGVFAGVFALRQMDDKPGVPLFADLIGSVRGRPLSVADPKSAHGLFIVFEGGEGAGKSTQVKRLAEELRAIGREVVVTHEPGATPIGTRIRSLVLDPPGEGGDVVTPRAEALLYAADRAHHVASVVRPALSRGSVVISDRYVDSSLAYQGAGRTLPVDEVSWLSKWATGGLKPDLVVLLDLDPSVGLARAGKRGPVDRLESESLAFHERVRYAFLDLAAADPSRYLVLDATNGIDALAEGILQRVRHLIPEDESSIDEVLHDSAAVASALTGEPAAESSSSAGPEAEGRQSGKPDSPGRSDLPEISGLPEKGSRV